MTPSPSDRTVRAATPADAADIAHVEALAAHAPWAVEAVARSLAAPTSAAWVVGSPVVGHLLTSCVAEEAEILTLAVLPAHRRRGLARLLLDACESRWREAGVSAAWLEVRADNDAARRLYVSRGWVDCGTRRRYYADGVDALVMRWSC